MKYIRNFIEFITFVTIKLSAAITVEIVNCLTQSSVQDVVRNQDEILYSHQIVIAEEVTVMR